VTVQVIWAIEKNILFHIFIINLPILFFWVQVLETTSCRNVGKGCVHKTQSAQTLPWSLRKRELCAPGCPFTNIIFLCFCHVYQ
jgi:hypothetical protein